MKEPSVQTNPVFQRPRRLVLACGALIHEMMALLNQNPEIKADTKVHCLPAKLHNTPQFIGQRVDEYLAENAHQYDEILIGYGDCGTGGELDRVLDKYNAQRIPGAHCYEFFAGSEVFFDLAEQELGTLYLTDYLVKNFQRLIIEGLGIDRYPELFEAYFKHYKKIVYLAQTDNTELQRMAKEYADDFGWVYEYRFTDIGGLKPILGANIGLEVA
ncbi:MAG: DUF1638 domain-containing protein [Pseudomonadota bacterium]